jgi:hypothetical protein
MLTSLQVAGLVGFNLLLLILLFVAFRLIGGGRDRQVRTRRTVATSEELFSFDSWSDAERPPRPMTDPGRSVRNRR